MSEEERRRRCIIDPDQCGGGPPAPFATSAFTPQEQATGEELYLQYKDPHDQPWGHLSPDHQMPFLRQARGMLGVFTFHLKAEHHEHEEKPHKGKAAKKDE